MKKYALSLIVLLAPCFSHSEELSEKEKLILQILDPGTLKTTIKTIYKKVQKDDTQVSATHLLMLAHNLKIYCIHPYAEADTGYSKKWFLSLIDTLKKMAEYRSKQESARTLKNATMYRESARAYNNDMRQLVRIMKHPIKVDKSELKALRKEARLKRRALERKADL